MLFCSITLAFTLSAFIDPDPFPWLLYQISCGPYPNWEYGFAHPTVLRNVVERVTVGRAYYPSVIYKFYSKVIEGGENQD